MKKKITKAIPLLVLAAGILCSCDNNKDTVKQLDPPANPKDSFKAVDTKVTPLANGIYDNSGLSASEKNVICEKLETFALDHAQVGVPLFSNGGISKLSPRVKLPIQKPMIGIGYDMKHAKLDVDGNMGNGKKAEFPNANNYLHLANSSDPGTFNYWISQGHDVSLRVDEIAGTYYDTRLTEDKESWEFVPGLASGMPIMLDRVETGERDAHNHKVKKYQVAHVEEAEKNTKTSRHWRIPLNCLEAFDEEHKDQAPKYATSEKSSRREEFHGTAIKLEDYFTPYEMMFKYKLYRYNQFSFEGIPEFTNGLIDMDGIGVHLNKEAKALDFTLTTPVNINDAIYHLNSSLAAPVPLKFIQACGKGKTVEEREKNGAEAGYGKIGESTDATKNTDNIISTGAYVCESWEANKEIRFKKNPYYYDAKNIFIEGKVETIIERIEQEYEEYKAGKLDMAGITPTQRKNEKGKPDSIKTKGATVFRLNLNTVDSKTWDAWFGVNGKFHKSKKGEPGFANDLDYYKNHLNPIIATPEFYQGVYFSINRKEIEETFVKDSEITFFNDQYMYIGSKPFRESKEGQEFTERIKTICGNEYGFNKQISQQYFDKAIARLINSDPKKYSNTAKKEIKLEAWFFQNMIEYEGAVIKKHIEESFNGSSNALKYNIKLTIENKTPGSAKWKEIYDRMSSGRYAMSIGGIGGSQFDPVGLTEVLSTTSELSYGFNTSWHEDTSKVFTKNEKQALTYNGEVFSYDSLVKISQEPTVVINGERGELINNTELSTKDENIVFDVDYQKFGIEDASKNPFKSWTDGDVKLSLKEIHQEQTDDVNVPGKKVSVDKPTTFAGNRGLEVEVKQTEFGKLQLVINKAKVEELAKQIVADRKAYCTAHKIKYLAPTTINISVELKYEYQKEGGSLIKGRTTISDEVPLSKLGIQLAD